MMIVHLDLVYIMLQQVAVGHNDTCGEMIISSVGTYVTSKLYAVT